MSKKAVEKRIMIFGTFDGLHPGHLNFFKQARDLASGAHLVVSVARDQNVLKIKGRKPVLSEKARALLVRKSGLADQVILGGMRNHVPHILKARPDIIALGYDQDAYVKNLDSELAQKKLRVKIIRLKPYKAKKYKNSLLRKPARG